MATNREGASVDPVPFFVASGLAILFAFSFGPVYLDAAFGFSLPVALATAFVVASALIVAAWHRLVWTVDPVARREVPASMRLRRLYYGVIVLGALLLLLLLPLW
ncbi:MAG: hypothetical protein ABEJ79_08380 [Halolamina sp.]